MTDNKTIFDLLAERMGAPGSKRFAKILAAMMTEQEGQILAIVSKPQPLTEIAKNMKMDEKTLQPIIADMEQRQVIRKTPQGYMSPGNIVAFHHGAIGWMREDLKAKVYPLWGDFFFEEWSDILVDGFIKQRESGARRGHRIVPSYLALRASPELKPEQILWYEDMEQVLKRAERIMVMMCGCRGLWRKCDNPVDTCFQFEFPTDGPRRKREDSEFIKPPKDLTLEEGLALVAECEKRGLVHIPLNTSYGDMYCNCCNDCCMVITPLLKRGGGKVYEILSPSRYRAKVDKDLCSGCQTCVDRCFFDAIEMQPVAGSKKLKASVNSDHCMGCGNCVVTCPQKALTMELVRPADHIPTIPLMKMFAPPPVKAAGSPG